MPAKVTLIKTVFHSIMICGLISCGHQNGGPNSSETPVTERTTDDSDLLLILFDGTCKPPGLNDIDRSGVVDNFATLFRELPFTRNLQIWPVADDIQHRGSLWDRKFKMPKTASYRKKYNKELAAAWPEVEALLLAESGTMLGEKANQLESCLFSSISVATRYARNEKCNSDGRICDLLIFSDLLEACTHFDRTINSEAALDQLRAEFFQDLPDDVGIFSSISLHVVPSATVREPRDYDRLVSYWQGGLTKRGAKAVIERSVINQTPLRTEAAKLEGGST